MKKSLLMTTALVALVSASHARAEDWTVSAPESIENQILNKDNVTIQTGGEVAISGDTESGIIAKSFTMEGGKLTATSVNGSADTGIFVKSDSSDINLNGGTIELTNSRIYKGNDTETSGDINISGGDITLNKDGNFKGPIDKFLSDDERKKLIEKADMKENSVLFFIADKKFYNKWYNKRTRSFSGPCFLSFQKIKSIIRFCIHIYKP